VQFHTDPKFHRLIAYVDLYVAQSHHINDVQAVIDVKSACARPEPSPDTPAQEKNRNSASDDRGDAASVCQGLNRSKRHEHKLSHDPAKEHAVRIDARLSATIPFTHRLGIDDARFGENSRRISRG
jgi:hypothetical protein